MITPRLPGRLEDWKTVAVSFMRTPANIEAVELVASALLENDSLTGDHCAGLIERAAGLPEHILLQLTAWEALDPAL